MQTCVSAVAVLKHAKCRAVSSWQVSPSIGISSWCRVVSSWQVSVSVGISSKQQRGVVFDDIVGGSAGEIHGKTRWKVG